MCGGGGRGASKVDFPFWWMHFAIGNFIDNISDWPFSCTLQIMERSPLNRNAFFLHYTLLNLFQSKCFTFGNHSLSSEGNIKYSSYVKAKIFR